MANEKFTQLPTTVSAGLTDIIPAVQGGVSVQETLSQVVTLARNNIVLNYAGNPNGGLAGTIYQFCWDTSNLILYICTQSGTTSTAVWTDAGSFAFPLALSLGGTSKALTAANGGIVYSDANSMEILTPTVTANQVLLSGSSSAPAWSTATYPATTTINQILYSSATNTVTGITTANSAMLYTSSAGVPLFSAPLTNGQLMIGSTGAAPTEATLTAGSGISITNGAGSITIASTGGSGYAWNEVTGTSANMVVDNGYIANNAALVTLTLPATAALGDSVAVLGSGAGGWAIAQNVNQTIHISGTATSTGVGGSVSSTNRYDSIELVCITANTDWSVLGAPQGTLTVV